MTKTLYIYQERQIVILSYLRLYICYQVMYILVLFFILFLYLILNSLQL